MYPDCRVIVAAPEAPEQVQGVKLLHHSERFYRLMAQVMPKWEKTKERLDGMASIITN